jgi:hypothetical protein
MPAREPKGRSTTCGAQDSIAHGQRTSPVGVSPGCGAGRLRWTPAGEGEGLSPNGEWAATRATWARWTSSPWRIRRAPPGRQCPRSPPSVWARRRSRATSACWGPRRRHFTASTRRERPGPPSGRISPVPRARAQGPTPPLDPDTPAICGVPIGSCPRKCGWLVDRFSDIRGSGYAWRSGCRSPE